MRKKITKPFHPWLGWPYALATSAEVSMWQLYVDSYLFSVCTVRKYIDR